MNNPLISIIKTGILTQRELFPDLPEDANGMPMLTSVPCKGGGCSQCANVCPTKAITVSDDEVTLDRGRCIGCNACVEACPTGTIGQDRSTRTAVRTREELVLCNREKPVVPYKEKKLPFRRSLSIREVATGDSASDLEIIAGTNAVFDIARFGIHYVASPRFADALLVTGPVGRAMQKPLLRCYDAMAEPRIVIAVGASAISGGLFCGDYAEASGVSGLLPITSYIPGDPPHPWSIIHGILLAMGRI